MNALPFKRTFTYDSSAFDVRTMAEAQRIILTEEEGISSARRWQVEAPWLMGLVERYLKFDEFTVTLDYGCGCGRLAKPILAKYNGTVVGADISANMRALATSAVESEKFFAVHPNQLHRLGFGWAHNIIAIWTLQHALSPSDEISRMFSAATPGASLLVVNNYKNRLIPTKEVPWADDGQDIRALTEAFFDKISEGQLDVSVLPSENTRLNTYWAVYRKKGVSLRECLTRVEESAQLSLSIGI